ncbi:MAG: hypothetical protein ACW98Y_08330 [Candidatus Thorarchaeota archaeon]|jgi:hypothetical protein
MSEDESVNLSLELSTYALFFTIVLAWSFLGVFLTQSLLLVVSTNIENWIFFLSITVITYPVPIIGFSYYVKQRTPRVLPEWNFVERDVGIEEYRTMVNEYNSAYPLFMSKVNINRMLFVVLLGCLSIFLPSAMVQYSIDASLLSPLIYGFCLIILGVGLIASILPALPGSLSEHFPNQSYKEYKAGARFLSQLPGIYWIGVRLTVGEWSGYYTLKDPLLSARIEGIESTVSLICQLDGSGKIIEISFVNESSHKGCPLDEPIPHPSPAKVKESMKKVLLWYIELSGDEEILQDVLDELMT